MRKQTTNYTKEFIEVTKKFYEISAKSNQVLDDIKETIKEINDKNVLHCQETTLALQEQKNSFRQNNQKIDHLTVNLKDYQDFIIKKLINTVLTMFVWVIGALIVLAGVKQILPLLQSFKL